MISKPVFTFGRVPFDAKKFVKDLQKGDAPRDRPEKGKYVDRATGKQSPIRDTLIPKLGPLPEPTYELRVPFEIANRPHFVWLKLSDPPVVDGASQRERLSERLAAAQRQVEYQLTWADSTRGPLLQQQVLDLGILIKAARDLEDEAKKLGDDPTDLVAADLPGLEELATQLAEYGERYDDLDLRGSWRALPAGDLEQTVTQPEQAVLPGTDQVIKGSVEEMRKWVAKLQSRVAPAYNAKYMYQRRVAGTTEYHAIGGNKKVWCDGVDVDATELLEAKYISKPGRSTYVPGSKAPDFIRENAQADIDDEFERYAAVVNDVTTSPTQARIIINDPAARQYFEDALARAGLPGYVVEVP